MMKATIQDKDSVTEILSKAFKANKSVNFTIRQDTKRLERLRSMMEYSFLTCLDFGVVWLNDCWDCCAVVLLADRKRFCFKSMFREVRLIWQVIGFFNLYNLLKREKLFKNRYRAHGMGADAGFYLWFIGTDHAFQGLGIGRLMMRFLLNRLATLGRKVYLEVSVERNMNWHFSFGFRFYDQLDLGYILYFLRK